jgi:cytidylate kinase
MPGITISAAYGAAGSAVAPRVAERMGWPFLDRAVSSSVAERLHLPVEEVEEGGSHPPRFARFLASLSTLSPQPLEDELALGQPKADEREIRTAAEEVLREAVRGSGAVILGRAGMCALLHEPKVLRVRLYGPREARIRQAAVVENVDLATARRRIDQVDPAREAYVRRLYGCSADDQDLFHLQLNSTVLDASTCVELIVAAYERLPIAGPSPNEPAADGAGT